MIKKCNIISIGKINKKLIIILLGGIFYTGTILIEEQSAIFGGNESETNHPIIYTLMQSLSLTLSFIFLIFYYKKIKGKNSQTKVPINEVNFRDKENIHKAKISWKEKLLWILLVAVIDFISLVFSNIYSIDNDDYVGIMHINIIYLAIFSYLILKMKLYKHHYLCIIVIFAKSLIFASICGLFDDFNSDDTVCLIVYLATELAFSFTYVMFKYYMIIKYIHTYEIMFFQGLIESILGIITLIVTTKLGVIDDFFDFKNNVKSKEIIILVSWIITNFVHMTILYKTIEIFNQFYLFIFALLPEYIIFFVKIETYKIYQIICNIFLMLISSFMILVFVEIIELNFFGLSYMTKRNIELRAQLDSLDNYNNAINSNKTFDNSLIDLKDYTYDVNNKNETFSSKTTKSFGE